MHTNNESTYRIVRWTELEPLEFVVVVLVRRGSSLEQPAERSQLTLRVVHEEHWVQLLTRLSGGQVFEVVKTCDVENIISRKNMAAHVIKEGRIEIFCLWVCSVGHDKGPL